ncbi:uncharacterized protein METZ01_LOCUS277358, partial [marine metagenome]
VNYRVNLNNPLRLGIGTAYNTDCNIFISQAQLFHTTMKGCWKLMSYRIEKDTMGEVRVPAEKYWGAQTERSRNNFKIGGPHHQMPIEIVRGFAYLKKAAAHTNYDLGVLT